MIDLVGQLVSLGLCLGHCLADLDEVGPTIGDRGDQALYLRRQLAMTLAQLFALPTEIAGATGVLAVIFTHVDLDRFGIEHLFGQAVQDARFHFLRRNGAAVGARRRAAFLVARATPAIGPANRPGAATGATAGNPGEHVLGPARQLRSLRLPAFEHGLRRRPGCFIDDAQLGGGLDNPFRFRLRDDHRLAGARIHHLTRAVEHQLADVEAVLQDAVAALSIAINRRGAPERRAGKASTGARHAIIVQAFGNRTRRCAGDVFGEDPAHNIGLILVDHAQSAHQLAAIVDPVGGAIAIGNAGGTAPRGDGAALAALDLCAEILAELRIHQSAEGGGDLGHFAIGQGEYPRAGEQHAFADSEGVALVARDPVGGLGEDLIDAARFDTREHRVQPGARAFIDAGGAADRIVGEDADFLPAFAGDAFAAQGDLILDRAGVLQGAGKAGVDYGAHWSCCQLRARIEPGA